MKDMIFKWIISWLVSNLTEEKIKEWMSDLKSKFVPWLETEKTKLIAKLREKAADTTTPLDDAAVTVFDTVLTQIIEWLKTK